MQNFLAGQGLNANVLADDVKKVSGTASDALTQAKPTVDSTIFSLSKSSPALLAEYALGAVALYYLVSQACVSRLHSTQGGLPLRGSAEMPLCRAHGRVGLNAPSRRRQESLLRLTVPAFCRVLASSRLCLVASEGMQATSAQPELWMPSAMTATRSSLTSGMLRASLHFACHSSFLADEAAAVDSQPGSCCR